MDPDVSADARADAGKADAGKADAGKADAGKADAGKADAGKDQPDQIVRTSASSGSAAIPFGSVGAVTVCSFLQLILQFLLVIWLAKRFGTSPEMDAFNAAFAVPTALTGIVVSPLPLVLVPELVRSHKAATELVDGRLGSAVLGVTMSVTLALAALVALLVHPICEVLFSGLDAARMAQTGGALRWLIWLLPLNAAITVLQAFHHGRQRYLTAALSNVLGVGLSVALIVLLPRLDLRAVSMALLAGSASAVVVLVLPLQKPLVSPFFFTWKGAGLRRFAWLAMPLFFSAAYAKLDPLIDRSIASFLPPGTISELGYAQRLVTALTTLTASGLSVVIFPQLSLFAAKANDPRGVQLLASAWRFLIVLLTPILVAVAVYGDAIVSDLFQRDAFDREATAAVAGLLRVLLGVLIAGSVGEIAAKSPYAMSKMRMAAVISMAAFTLGVLLKWVLSQRLGIEGVALGSTLSYSFGAVAFMLVLAATHGKMLFAGVTSALFQASLGSAAAVASGAVPVVMLDRGGAFCGGGVGLLVYLIVLRGLRNEFLRPKSSRSS